MIEPEQPPDEMRQDELIQNDKQLANKKIGTSLGVIQSTVYPEQIFAVPEILSIGLASLAGRPKVGKSWLALQLAHAKATGGRVLGYKVEKCKVLYFALEDTLRTIKERTIMQGWNYNGEVADFVGMADFQDNIGSLVGTGVDLLRCQIEEHGYKFVVVDTFSRAIHGDQNDSRIMQNSIIPLHRLAHDLDITLLFVDHHRKGGIKESDAIDSILGSTAKSALLDTAWGLFREKTDTKHRLEIIGREVQARTLDLYFDNQTLCYQSKGESGAIKTEMTTQRQDIIDAISQMGQCSVVDIAAALNLPKSNVFTQLKSMAAGGLIVREVGRNVFYDVPG